MGQLLFRTPKNDDNGSLESSFTEYFQNYKPKNKIISEETIHLIELHLKKGNIQGANSVINDALKNIDNAPINVAVTGESGAGKSSLINALRGVKDDGEGAAETGVTETTMDIKSYKHPKIKNLTLWDLPGIGTLKFPPKSYLEKVEFKKYDFFIVASSQRLTIHEVELAKAIRLMNKNYYFVRTKVDFDLDNEKKAKPRTFNRENTMENIRKSYLKVFIDNQIGEPQVFLISNHDLSDYEFPILMDTLVKDLPAQKRHNFMLSLPNVTEAAIERKYNSAKQCVWLEALKDGVCSTVPVVGILMDSDVEKLKASLNHYRDLFGVDDQSLEFMAKEAQVPVEQLKKKLKSPYLLETDKEETLGGKLLKYLEKFASANGGLLATGLYFRKSYYLHFYFLDTVTEDAKILLGEASSKN
ncbi:interferon-inducible GTPase 1-like [Meriones unguiculatus]|uniref:interferon-inducible GTPase 1-like n=1 Tax=Meriones unguiculatus TaxID=10047 RepID=UPI00293E6CED|nr:interferon-inducible GTPase 1-like [Meriones unguiculatus]